MDGDLVGAEVPAGDTGWPQLAGVGGGGSMRRRPKRVYRAALELVQVLTMASSAYTHGRLAQYTPRPHAFPHTAHLGRSCTDDGLICV